MYIGGVKLLEHSSRLTNKPQSQAGCLVGVEWKHENGLSLEDKDIYQVSVNTASSGARIWRASIEWAELENVLDSCFTCILTVGSDASSFLGDGLTRENMITDVSRCASCSNLRSFVRSWVGSRVPSSSTVVPSNRAFFI